MDELKLLERLLTQRDEGELQDYQGELDEERSAATAGQRNSASWDGVVQACLDQLRWRKTEEVIGLVWEPSARSSLAYMRQRCAMQVVMERKGEQFLHRLLREQRKVHGRDLTWLDSHDIDPTQVEIGLYSAGAWRMEEQRDAPGKDAKRAEGGERTPGHGATKAATRKEPLVTGANNTAYGHMETWITDRARAREQDGHFRVGLEQLDLHTQVQIRGRQDAAWSPIEDFEEHYGGDHDTSFATYDGVLLHENQHVEERTQVFNKYLPWLRDHVSHIEAETEQEAFQKYEEIYEEFERKVDTEYFTIGEVPARALEWEYYHAAYEQETGERGVSRGAARAAGAAQGKKETARQLDGMQLMAQASERSGPRPVSARRASGGVGVERPGGAERASSVFGGPSAPGGRPTGRSGAGTAAPRPRLVALLQDGRLRRNAVDDALRFGGTRPVFALDAEARVSGAKVGVPVAEDARWARRPARRTASATQRGVAPSAAAADWVLKWWRDGADDDELERA